MTMSAIAHYKNLSDAVVGTYAEKKNRNLELSAERIMLVMGYLQDELDRVNDSLDGMNTPFSMRLKNRTARVVRDLSEFMDVLGADIQGAEKREAWVHYTDIFNTCLDSFFATMHSDEHQASLDLKRKAKLRYHDPYKVAVRECTEAFEDGYVKGFCDCVDEFAKSAKKHDRQIKDKQLK